MRRAPALLLLLVTVLGTVPAAAEHEVYYRYVVLGYVKDARGKPLAGRSVELTRDKTGFSYLADTDDKGFYLIIARLGDESAGEALTLTVGRSRAKLAARFDPANHTEDRGTRVDLQGARFVERSAWFRSTLAQAMAAPRR
ncbi:MAG: carboxypeptidase regulatory-like domain-containing protein [Candidatus Rokubacteria bacterium]|nr:carboxypeptidase regulatory-like domain-containing protein [Candidatus Rokubacteria bacterium]